MKILRFHNPDTDTTEWGILEGDKIALLQGDPLSNFKIGPSVVPFSTASLAAPCRPSKIICAAINFHGALDWQPGMTEPLFFLKSPNSICGPQDKIISQFTDAPVWGEAELTIVIGRPLSKATQEQAAEGIYGYTVANDVSAENISQRDHHLARSKSADTFCPLGPYIDTDFNPANRWIEGFHNDVLVRKGNTRDFFWNPVQIVQSLSKWMNLEPWDIILTGSPPMQCPFVYFQEGDCFVAQVEGFPPLRSTFHQARPLDPHIRNEFFKASITGLTEVQS